VTCNEIQNMTVPYLELDGDPARLREVTAHLEICLACRSEMEAVRQVLVRLKQQRVPDPGERFWSEFPKSVRAGILRETIDAQAAMPQDTPSSEMLGAGRQWSSGWSWALAASVLILVIAGLLLGDQFLRRLDHNPVQTRTILTGDAVTAGQGSDLADFAEADWDSTWDEDDSDTALARMAAHLDRQALDRLFTDI
jgi:hypothetical protein